MDADRSGLQCQHCEFVHHPGPGERPDSCRICGGTLAPRRASANR